MGPKFEREGHQGNQADGCERPGRDRDPCSKEGENHEHDRQRPVDPRSRPGRYPNRSCTTNQTDEPNNAERSRDRRERSFVQRDYLGHQPNGHRQD